MAQRPDDQHLRRVAAQAGATFVAAIAASDVAAATVPYAPGARLLAPSVEPIEGREAIAAFWRAGIDAGIRAIERVTSHVERHGSIAVEIGRYAIQVEPSDGEPLVDRGKYLLVHEVQGDSSWRWVVEMLSPDGPPAPSPSTHRYRRNGEEVAND